MAVLHPGVSPAGLLEEQPAHRDDILDALARCAARDDGWSAHRCASALVSADPGRARDVLAPFPRSDADDGWKVLARVAGAVDGGSGTARLLRDRGLADETCTDGPALPADLLVACGRGAPVYQAEAEALTGLPGLEDFTFATLPLGASDTARVTLLAWRGGERLRGLAHDPGDAVSLVAFGNALLARASRDPRLVLARGAEGQVVVSGPPAALQGLADDILLDVVLPDG